MIHRKIHIEDYDWVTDIYYDVRALDADIIADKLEDMGCSIRNVRKAFNLIDSDSPNIGLTYSNKNNHHTLIVIGYVTSIAEFFNTLVHEIDHLTDHISQFYKIPYASEDNSYLIGYIAKTICEDTEYGIKDFFC